MTLLTEKEFWPEFIQELNKATGHVLIECAFVSDFRLEDLERTFKALIARGVTICMFIQKPKYWNTPTEKLFAKTRSELENLKSCCRTLESWGIHVNLRRLIHGKLVMIDHRMHYEGSLNVLSHKDGKEHMRRFTCPSEVTHVLDKLELNDCSTCDTLSTYYWTGSPSSDRLARIGKIIATARKKWGLKKSDLSRATGIARTRIHAIEAGTNMTLESFFKLTDQLGLEVLIVPKHMVFSVCNFLRKQVCFQPTNLTPRTKR